MGYVLKVDYDNRLKNQIDAANKSSEAAKMPIDYNISQAPKTYDPQRMDAYTQNQTDQRTLRERMANMGFGASGGTSQKQNYKQMNDFQGKLTGIDLNQQNYINQQNVLKGQIDAQNKANISALTAQNEIDRNNATIAQQNQNVSNYLNLYLAGKISKQQFQKLTGLVV